MAAIFLALELIRRLESIERNTIHRRRSHRIRQDAFSIPDAQFLALYKLPKHVVGYICQRLQAELKPVSGVRTALPVEIKVLCALRYYATGSFQRNIGQHRTIAISQSSVSRAVVNVSKAINKVLLHEFISYPSTKSYQSLKQKFKQISGFPDVIGAVDCIQIAIAPPSENNKPYPGSSYLNSNKFHSLNVQIVCDADLSILNLITKYPGSTSDALIWQWSALRQFLDTENMNGKANGWLLGDSSYPLEPWLMTPLAHAKSPSELKYNECHEQTRSVVTRCSQMLMSRFRCLNRHRLMQHSPDIAAEIINTCAVLHNLCIRHGVPHPEINLLDFPNDTQNNVHNVKDDESAWSIRQELIQKSFST